MRVLITGVAGFIGSNLADLLVDKHEVCGIDDLSSGRLENIPDGVDFIIDDVRNIARADFDGDFDVIFHLAAKTCVPECELSPMETLWNNLDATRAVFDYGAKRIIYAESSALYEGIADLPTPEDKISPKSIYAISKTLCHYLAKFYDNTIGLRYFNVYGSRQNVIRDNPPLMGSFIRNILNGDPCVINGTGEKRRDFVYVDDLNRFHELLMTEDVIGEVFNVGSGKNYSVIEIYHAIAELMDEHREPFHSDDLEMEAIATLADITKAKGLGWSPEISLEEGLRRQIETTKAQR